MAVPSTHEETLEQALGRVREPLLVGRQAGSDLATLRELDPDTDSVTLDPATAYVPACRLEDLGDPAFRTDHGVQYACVAGAMANGIASVELVEAMAHAGMLGIFGAAGLPLGRVEHAVDRLQRSLGTSRPYGFNLIHSPGEPALEAAVADLYLKRGVRLVEASAFLDLTLPIVRYRVKGLQRSGDGRIVATNRVIAKVSRVEVATKFLAPAPDRFLRELLNRGEITPDQAEWASRMPLADDLTAEADSGGHTDNQPAIVLIPTMIALRDRLRREFGYESVPRVGAAGGISTPWAVAGALAMGASYLVTGSINQACVESGTSDTVRKMLAEARQADIAMAPAADMFEMGVKVQVLKRGTMFAMRAARLYELYRAYDRLEAIPEADRATLEKTIFRLPLETVWAQTQAFFRERDPAQIERGLRDPKHKMALVFRWYLGQSSAWANAGEPSRAIDYQVWCGPAMAAFNEWVRGSFLEEPAARRAGLVSLNLLHGAAVLARARSLALQGVALPPGVPRLAPLTATELEPHLARSL
ncbi:MAG: PfaD family polyunsaturated fatty acid/polyketide biosynthesis protein [Isosphaeraceae bacterium]